jgi:hypothetical protein
MASRTTLGRFVRAGVIRTTANGVPSEVHRTWNRPEAGEIAKLYTEVAPNYRALIESYEGAGSGAAAEIVDPDRLRIWGRMLAQRAQRTPSWNRESAMPKTS